MHELFHNPSWRFQKHFRLLASSSFLDLSATAGGLALSVKAQNTVVLESSRAALRCATQTLKGQSHCELAAGLSWDAEPESFESSWLLPATDKGTARVIADLNGTYTALKAGGRLVMLMHKDQGAKRYEKQAAQLFGGLDVIAKDGGWRLSQLQKRQSGTATNQLLEFEASGLRLVSEPGVYAAGKLDPGTALLLDSYDTTTLQGKNVLDLGCGYGLLALKASLAGGAVTAVDDDLAAVRSTHQNAQEYGLDIRVLHSDINSELKDSENFDTILTNPPFHRGKQVVLEVPQAFIAAARKHLKPGGELVMVANKALSYEPLLAQFAHFETLAVNASFKVLRAVA